ncbi:MAG: ABC transporter permease [Acidobacteriota bacterium]|nr:ABC transporter permease [Acidobacteriota bacterium]
MKAAIRQLARAPAFALTASASLALAVGANTAIFSIVNALWLRPLPVSAPDRIVVPYYPVVHSGDGEMLDDVRLPDAEALRGVAAFEAVTFELNAGLRMGDWRPIVRLRPGLEEIAATAVERSYFETLGVAVRGRYFREEEDAFGAPAVAIISSRLFRRLSPKGGQPGAVLDTARGPITVVGIAADGFHGPRVGDQVDLWITIGALRSFSDMAIDPRMRPHTPLAVFARLRSGVAVEAAQDESRAILDSRTTLRSLEEVPFALRSEGTVARQRILLKTLWIAAGLVLALGAANLAALLVARAAFRRHHWAVRLSLGSTRGALIRNVLAEVALIAAGGLLLGLVFRSWLLQSVPALELTVAVARLDPSLDWRVLLFALAVVIVSMGIASAGAIRQAARADLALVLAAASSTGTRRTALTRQALLAAHVALAVALLVTATALIGAVRHALSIDMGFVRDRTIFARVRPALTQYIGERDDAGKRQQDYRAVIARIAQLPSVAAVTYGAPMLRPVREETTTTPISVDGVTRQMALTRYEVGPAYLTVAGAGFIEGRDLTAADADAAPTRQQMMKYITLRRLGREAGLLPGGGRSAAVIDSALASALWPGQSAVGKLFTWAPLQMTHEVVGVVGNLGRRPARDGAVPTLVVAIPLSSYEGTAPYDLIVSTRAGARPETAAIVAVLRELFPEAPFLEVRTARQMIERQIAQERMGARIFSWYAVAAAVLGLVGTYGLLAFFTAETRRELAIRAALGATGSSLMRTTAARVLAPAAIGVLSGLVLSAWLRRILGSTVIGLGDTGAMAEASAATLFLSACVIVTMIGTRKLRCVNPAEVLHRT